MQITSLPATTNLSANDVLAVEVNGITYKITASNLAGILQTLSGTLPIAQGGTGMTASPSLQVNLASSSAANVLQASPRPGVTGILPLANGGLGTSDPAQARTALETAYSKYFAPPAGTSFTFTIPNGARTLFLFGDSNTNYNAIFFVVSTASGVVNVVEVFPGSFTYDKTVANKLTFIRSASGNNNILIINLKNTESSMPSLDS